MGLSDCFDISHGRNFPSKLKQHNRTFFLFFSYLFRSLWHIKGCTVRDSEPFLIGSQPLVYHEFNQTNKQKVPVGIQVGGVDAPEPVVKEFHSPEQRYLHIPSCGQPKQASLQERGQTTLPQGYRVTDSSIKTGSFQSQRINKSNTVAWLLPLPRLPFEEKQERGDTLKYIFICSNN